MTQRYRSPVIRRHRAPREVARARGADLGAIPEPTRLGAVGTGLHGSASCPPRGEGVPARLVRPRQHDRPLGFDGRPGPRRAQAGRAQCYPPPVDRGSGGHPLRPPDRRAERTLATRETRPLRHSSHHHAQHRPPAQPHRRTTRPSATPTTSRTTRPIHNPTTPPVYRPSATRAHPSEPHAPPAQAPPTNPPHALTQPVRPKRPSSPVTPPEDSATTPAAPQPTRTSVSPRLPPPLHPSTGARPS